MIVNNTKKELLCLAGKFFLRTSAFFAEISCFSVGFVVYCIMKKYVKEV